MRSRTGHSLSTLMFMVPLLGVPLMAVFGVPQFVPVIASSVSQDSSRLTVPRPLLGVGESAAASFVADDALTARDEPTVHDLFGSSRRPQRDSRPVRRDGQSGRETKFLETSLNAENWLTSASPDETNAQLSDLFGEPVVARSAERNSVSPTRSHGLSAKSSAAQHSRAAMASNATEHMNEGITWRDAVQRLNDLGIQEFRLEPGSRLGEFYFSCEFTPQREARVTRRFEAEATEPLMAVRAVLRQIDDWLAQR